MSMCEDREISWDDFSTTRAVQSWDEGKKALPEPTRRKCSNGQWIVMSSDGNEFVPTVEGRIRYGMEM